MAFCARSSSQISCSKPARGAAPLRLPAVVCRAATEDAQPLTRRLAAGLMTVASAAALTLSLPSTSWAVSGGGGFSESMAGKDLSGQDLRKFKFTKANLRKTNFSGANLEGVSLFSSLSEGAVFTGANLRNADLESGNYEDADFTNAVLEGAFVNNAQFINVKITGSDWTDVVLRKDIQKELCTIASGVNPTTGVDTRESLYCR